MTSDPNEPNEADYNRLKPLARTDNIC